MFSKEGNTETTTSKETPNRLTLEVSKDCMSCWCSYTPIEGGESPSISDVEQLLDHHGVKSGINWSVVNNIMIEAAAGKPLKKVLVAQGVLPEHGIDAYLDITADCSTLSVDPQNADTDMDMYQVQAFINVESGDQIARIVPPAPGIPGTDVLGIALSANHGEPLKPNIGQNIVVIDGVLTATNAGRICFDHGEISVQDLYTVRGDVGFKVGTINFNGYVDVLGDVRDNFNISATKGITVKGNIGKCLIVSEGDVTLNGLDHGAIVCGGTLRANFLHQSTIECADDVIVTTEIHDCSIRTLGKIIVEKGAIFGGTCIARGGIETRRLGSASSKPTKLHAGADYRDAESLDSLLTSLREIEDKAMKTDSLREVFEMQKQMVFVLEAIDDIQLKAGDKANPKVNIKGVLYENVKLTVGRTTEVVRDKLTGACSLFEDPYHRGLYYTGLSCLNIKISSMVFSREFAGKRLNERLTATA